MKYLGIDFGLRKIGIALGDDVTNIAAPLEVVENNEDLLVYLATMVEQEDIDSVIVGLPSREQGEVTKEFVQELERIVKVPVYLEDESYSSVESQRLQKEYGSRVEEDALAAMLILQAYLDRNAVERR